MSESPNAATNATEPIEPIEPIEPTEAIAAIDLMLAAELAARHPEVAARALEAASPAAAAALLQGLPSAAAAGVLARMDVDAAATCLLLLEPRAAAPACAAMPRTVAALVLARLEAAQRNTVLDALPRLARRALELAMRYPAGSAAALMNPHAPALPATETVAGALEHMRRAPMLAQYVYVVDGTRQLVGAAEVARLVVAPPQAPLGEHAERADWTLLPTSSRQAVLVNPGWRRHNALPVVDEEGVLLGELERRAVLGSAATRQRRVARGPVDAGASLGELYWLGFSSLVQSASTPITATQRQGEHQDEAVHLSDHAEGGGPASDVDQPREGR